MTAATVTASPFAAFYAAAKPEAAETVEVSQILRLVSRDGSTQLFVCYRNANHAEQDRGCFGPVICGVFAFEALPKTLRDMALKLSIFLQTTEHTLAEYRRMAESDRYSGVRYWPGQYLPLV
jgi:hypothetical protein